MTQVFLQDAVVEDLKDLFKHHRLTNSMGIEREVQVYAQDLPIREDTDEPQNQEAPPEPYVVVRVRGGKTQDEDAPQIIEVVLVVCVYDKDRNRQGYRDALHYQRDLPSLFRQRRDRKEVGDPLPHGMDHPGGGHAPVLFCGHVPARSGPGGP